LCVVVEDVEGLAPVFGVFRCFFLNLLEESDGFVHVGLLGPVVLSPHPCTTSSHQETLGVVRIFLFGSEEEKEVRQTEAPAEEPQKKEDKFIIRFREYIEQHMSDSNLGVETIGMELGLSRVQLYRKVKALTGQSPVELLRTVRLHKARRLLQDSVKSISEVAYEVGFTSPSYFTKCFKDEFGVSPSELIS
jgi:AraC-like DNA-binding protein